MSKFTANTGFADLVNSVLRYKRLRVLLLCELDVRITIATREGALIYMAGAGRRVMEPAMIESLVTFEDWAALDVSSYYLRLLPTFETGDVRYEKLNGIVSVGVGHFTSKGVAFDLHEIL